MGTDIAPNTGGGLGSSSSTGGRSSGDEDEEPEEQTSIDDYADDVGITDRQGQTIEERRERLENVLNEALDVEDSHQFGSHTRGTMVGPLDEDSDTDIMVVLAEDEHGQWARDKNGAQNCLQAVKRALEKRYPNSEVSIDRNVVQVKFHDFTAEVAPAFKRGDGYVIPDTYSEGRSWVKTNPRQYKQQFDAVDQARGGRLKKVARVAKKFNDNHGKPVSSYHMEVMVYHHVRTHPDKNVSTEALVEGFMEQLPQRISNGTQEPVYGDRVDANMDSKERREAIKAARTARKHMRRANRLRRQGNIEAAEEAYSEALGEDIDQ